MSKHRAEKVKKRPKAEIVVEDHGNGFMVVGTDSILKARMTLRDYVDDVDVYRYACPTWYENRHKAVWLGDGPGAYWEGSTDTNGQPLRK